MKQILATASVLALLATPVWAQSNRPASRTTESATTSQHQKEAGKTALNQQDHGFVEQAAQGGLAEVQAGKLAEQKASDPAVQEFGRWMVADHEMANKRLKGIAKREDVNIPNEPSSTQQSQYAQLQKLSGSQFDHQYIQGQVQGHQMMISLFEKQESAGGSRALKTYARQTLPLLRAHLQEAEILSKNMGVASTRSRTEGSGSSVPPARSTHQPPSGQQR
jgi:putative membrane protein